MHAQRDRINMAELPAPSQPTLDAIYRAYEAKADRKHRSYLGMSTMGNECDRALWMTFRWAHAPESLDGRKLRLFETGHREEARMLDDLEMAGIAVHRVDPETGAQWALSALGGHFRGHMDGQGAGFEEAPKTVHVLEFKTHNEKSFKALVKDGVKKAKPGHYAQMQLYMHFSGLSRAFYMAVNKNTDEIHTERIEYDGQAAIVLVARAESIILSEEPPPRLHDDPTAKMAWVCSYCPAFNQCHGGQFAPRSCRTCIHSTPVDGGWNCQHHGSIDTDTQLKGCSLHLYIPGLVPGEQIDADPEHGTVSYSMADGTTWIDGEQS